MLKEYNKKRNFSKTKEPEGKVKKSKGALKFVVQKHDATQLHYDFRLEADGVLKSWAVPKGPQLDPKVKRLAMQVEDHPFDYLKFEGVIPEGEYGAGEVIVWDLGTYHSLNSTDRDETEKEILAGLKKGEIKIYLEGEKLKGEFALVKTSFQKNSWLLIKHNDEFATTKSFDETSVLTKRDLKELKVTEDKEDADLAGLKEAKMPTALKPMLSNHKDEPFDSEEWIFERKYDGYRIISILKDGKVTLLSRNGHDYTDKYEKVVEDLEKLDFDAIFDGEVVAMDKKGNHSFQLLQYYTPKDARLKYYIFDVLYFDKFDLTSLPLTERKKILTKLITKGTTIDQSKYIDAKGIEFFKKEIKKFEGIMAKKKDSIYEIGARTDQWLKIKNRETREAIICGYTDSTNPKIPFGSLVLGRHSRGKLVLLGGVGTGFGRKEGEELKVKMQKLETKDSPFENVDSIRDKLVVSGKIHWLKPKLVCEVAYAEITKDGLLRQASFLRMREDKDATEV